MWLLVLFDMPTTTVSARKAAAKFRNALQGLGFERMQLSVYARRCPGSTSTMTTDVRRAVPPYGDVCVAALTDLQFESLLRLKDGRLVVFEKPTRLVLF
jgi:CRISPR-associated protein Cas2